MSRNNSRRQRIIGGVLGLYVGTICAAEPQLSETAVASNTDDQEQHWVDASHAADVHRTKALVQWMDDFFGASVHDTERADSFLRTILIDDWDQRDSHDPKIRLRGQVSLPKISERVDLYFNGAESEQTLTEEERSQESDVGVRFSFRDARRLRLDATLSVRSGPAILPGVRLRYQQPITENSWARLTHRLQYHSDDGVRSLTNFEANRLLTDKSLLRLSGRVRYREEKSFWDWNAGIAYRRWLDDHEEFPSAIEYFVAASGRDQPQNFETNYRIGFLYRKQFFRHFLFYEIEPNYNWRRDTYEEERKGVLGIVFRLEYHIG